MPSPECPWYVLMVKSRHEKVVATALENNGYPEFLPLYEKRTRSCSHTRVAQLPLFPMYVFCRFDAHNQLPVLMIPGVLSVVSFGRVPARVDDQEIASIQALVRTGMDISPCPYVEVGQLVEVITGPLQGLQGVILGFRGKCRMVLSVTLLRRSICLEVDWATVRPVVPAYQTARHLSSQPILTCQ